MAPKEMATVTVADEELAIKLATLTCMKLEREAKKAKKAVKMRRVNAFVWSGAKEAVLQHWSSQSESMLLNREHMAEEMSIGRDVTDTETESPLHANTRTKEQNLWREGGFEKEGTRAGKHRQVKKQRSIEAVEEREKDSVDTEEKLKEKEKGLLERINDANERLKATIREIRQEWEEGA